MISAWFHVKNRTVKIRVNSKPWMNGKLRKEMNKRYKLLKAACKTTKGSNEWKDYKQQRNKCTKLIRQAEVEHWKNKFEECNNTKSFWKTVNEFQCKRYINKIGSLKNSKNEKEIGFCIIDSTSLDLKKFERTSKDICFFADFCIFSNLFKSG